MPNPDPGYYPTPKKTLSPTPTPQLSYNSRKNESTDNRQRHEMAMLKSHDRVIVQITFINEFQFRVFLLDENPSDVAVEETLVCGIGI